MMQKPQNKQDLGKQGIALGGHSCPIPCFRSADFIERLGSVFAQTFFVKKRLHSRGCSRCWGDLACLLDCRLVSGVFAPGKVITGTIPRRIQAPRGRPRGGTAQSRQLRILHVEQFEPRLLLSATYEWTGLGTNNNWSTAANWLGDVAPTDGALLELGPVHRN